jgi:LacI family transcriptional regulator
MNVFLDRQVDGLIIAATEGSESQIADLKDNSIPVVLIDRYFPGLEVSHVAIDNFTASYNAVKHLVASGVQNIALVTHESTLFHMQERLNGYLHALTDCDLPVHSTLIQKISGLRSKEEVEKAIDELLFGSQRAQAILFTSNVLSTLALKYINTLPVKVPQDLSIISFDESEAAYLFYAPLTHIKQPLEEMGKAATKILLDLMHKTDEIKKVNLQAELVIGRSTLPVFADEEQARNQISSM